MITVHNCQLAISLKNILDERYPDYKFVIVQPDLTVGRWDVLVDSSTTHAVYMNMRGFADGFMAGYQFYKKNHIVQLARAVQGILERDQL